MLKVDIIQEITEFGKKMDVDIKAEDISAAHRIGRSGQSGPRYVICKFISRQTKDKVMKNRRKLKFSVILYRQCMEFCPHQETQSSNYR